MTGEDRSQLLLLPDAVDDYVGPDNPVRFMDAFVDGLDLEAAGFQRVQPRGKGRPGYDPADLLRLYIYGYLNRIRSSRRLEPETHRNLEVTWLLRQLRPGFKTITDIGLLAETAIAARENLAVCRIAAVADRGYYKIEDIEACEAAGITPYVAKPDRSQARSSDHFTKSEFEYDAATDTYRCPAGERLAARFRTGVDKSRTDTYLVDYANPAACRGCGLRKRCTKGTYRRLRRFENESSLERMAERLAARPEVMERRRTSVEHPFGSIKQWMGQGAFLTRRLVDVRGEFSLTALACNMRRAINLVGIPVLIAAVAR